MKNIVLMVSLLIILLLNACTISEPLISMPTDVSEVTIPPTTPTTLPTFFQIASSTPSPTHTSASAPPTKTPAGTQKVTLMAVGDIMLGRTIGEMILQKGFEAPFEFTAETLNSADITVGNLECPISDLGEAEEKTYAFRAPTAAGDSLAYAGFTLVNLANNHTLDYGPQALAQTIEILNSRQIHTVGAGMDDTLAYAPIFLEVNGLRMAFLAYADIPPTDYDYPAWEAGPNQPGIAWAHHHKISEGVSSAKKQADVVIVFFHNGYEIIQNVSKYQQEVAHLAIDSGAALVIGSHPHVLQRIETYNGGLIAYSMGNFVFDNFLFPPNYSAILSVELSPQGVQSYALIDVIVQLNGVPQIVPYNLD